MNRIDRSSFLYWFAVALTLSGCIFMIMMPTLALYSAKKGIALWVDTVLPALLPFFICANFMTALGVPNIIGQYFEKAFQIIFGAPGSSAFVFIISITSGYPMGPALIGDLGRRKEITQEEAKSMLSFCSTSGPLFILGTVGVGMLHSPLAGTIIAISHYLGAILNGILYHILRSRKPIHRRENLHRNRLRYESKPGDSLMLLFTNSLLSSMKTLGIICCYIVVFTLVTDLLEVSGILNVFQQESNRGFLKGLLEMTVGSNSIALASDLGLRMKCIMISFLISFGGLSTFAQSMSVMHGLGIRAFDYLKLKLNHGALSCIIAYYLSPAILNKSIVTVGVFGESDWSLDLGALSQLLFSTRMIIIIIIVFIITIGIDNILNRKGSRIK